MYEIPAAILELSGADDVAVHVRNNNLLTVNLSNSPLNDGDPVARHELAETAARKAYAMFSARDSLERG